MCYWSHYSTKKYQKQIIWITLFSLNVLTSYHSGVLSLTKAEFGKPCLHQVYIAFFWVTWLRTMCVQKQTKIMKSCHLTKTKKRIELTWHQEKILIFLQRGSFLPSTSLLQCQVNDRTIVHVVIGQGVGILDKNTLKKRSTEHYSIIQLTNKAQIKSSQKKNHVPHTVTSVFLLAFL